MAIMRENILMLTMEGIMRLRRNNGFTLIEVIVVAGIIAILAGILVPWIFKELDESRITRATADMKSIQTAIMVFRKDTGKWPSLSDDCASPVTLLEGKGNPATNDITTLDYDISVTKPFNDYLASNNGCFSNWKGPYMADVTADPWGRKYYLNAMQFDSQEMIWIISAGPNGVLETSRTSPTIVGDDIGILMQYGSSLT